MVILTTVLIGSRISCEAALLIPWCFKRLVGIGGLRRLSLTGFLFTLGSQIVTANGLLLFVLEAACIFILVCQVSRLNILVGFGGLVKVLLPGHE